MNFDVIITILIINYLLIVILSSSGMWYARQCIKDIHSIKKLQYFTSKEFLINKTKCPIIRYSCTRRMAFQTANASVGDKVYTKLSLFLIYCSESA